MGEFTRVGEKKPDSGRKQRRNVKELRKPGERGADKEFLVGRSDQPHQTQQESSDETRARKMARWEQCHNHCAPRPMSHSSGQRSALLI